MNAALRPVHPGQYLFLGILLVFITYIMLSVALRSQGRRSIVTAQSRTDTTVSEDLGLAQGEGTKLKLQDFHRVEVKDGRPVWEIRAKDASYFANDALSHINNASVLVYRSANSAVSIQSKAAKLHLNGESLHRAELEGDVQVVFDKSLHIQTEYAVFDERRREIQSPIEVTISGDGFEVKGHGLTVQIDEQIVELAERVYSRFEPSAQAPQAKSIGQLLGQ